MSSEDNSTKEIISYTDFTAQNSSINFLGSYFDESFASHSAEEKRILPEFDSPEVYRIHSKLNVLKELAEKGRVEYEQNKEYLEIISNQQLEIIKYQKNILVNQENIIKASKKEHAELSHQIAHLQSELSVAEQRIKEAIENKYQLNEEDIIRSFKENPSEYTIIYSKILLFFAVILLAVHFVLGVTILKSAFLYIGIIALSTFLAMGKFGKRKDI